MNNFSATSGPEVIKILQNALTSATLTHTPNGTTAELKLFVHDPRLVELLHLLTSNSHKPWSIPRQGVHASLKVFDEIPTSYEDDKATA